VLGTGDILKPHDTIFKMMHTWKSRTLFETNIRGSAIVCGQERELDYTKNLSLRGTKVGVLQEAMAINGDHFRPVRLRGGGQEQRPGRWRCILRRILKKCSTKQAYQH
jgi:hypothetical protein